MKTIEIKGKLYVPVVERVKEFHTLHPEGTIETHILSMGNDEITEDGKSILKNDKRVVVKAVVKFPKLLIETKGLSLPQRSWLVFTGHSQAVYGTGMMGDVALEIAETSAIGRALGFANIGLLDGIASADEIRKVKKVKVGEAEGDDDLGF